MEDCLIFCVHRVLIYDHLCRKRIEAQLQEIEQKSEKKKLEVRALAVCPTTISSPVPPNVISTSFFCSVG